MYLSTKGKAEGNISLSLLRKTRLSLGFDSFTPDLLMIEYLTAEKMQGGRCISSPPKMKDLVS